MYRSFQVFGLQGKNFESSEKADRVGAVKKFVEAFESASTWQSLSDESASRPSNSMDAQIDDIHSNMTILKEVTQEYNLEISSAVCSRVCCKPQRIIVIKI